MASVEERINKLREERVAREKARIEKLRELNLKKYGKTDIHQPKSASTVSLPVKSKSDTTGIVKSTTNPNKNYLQGNTTKRQNIPVLKKIPSKVSNNAKNVSGYINKVSIVDNIKKDKPAVSKIASKLPKAKNEPNKARNDKPLKDITSEVNIKSINGDIINNPQITITEPTPVKDAKKAINNKFSSKPDLTEVNIKSINGDIIYNPQITITEPTPVKDAKKAINNKFSSKPDLTEVNIKSINGDIINNPQITITEPTPVKDAKKAINNKFSSKPDLTEVNIKSINGDIINNPQITITEPTPVKDAKKAINNKFNSKPDLKSRKSIAVMSKTENRPKSFDSRKSIQPQKSSNKESVFDRLYKPKVVQKHTNNIDNVLKLKTDPSYLKKVINESRLIMNKRNTSFESKPNVPVRRSISAVHFKRISKNELDNCFHKWASIGEKIDKVHLKDINEDDCVKEEKVVSAVKSERKKVKFQTPVPYNFNTPKPEEMQARLLSWLKKRGKSIDSYHHLQCFGLHNLSRDIRPLNIDTVEFDDENKENIALEHDSDNDSYLENMNNRVGDLNDENKVEFPKDKWRRVSSISDSVDYNESYDTTLTSGEGVHHVDDLLIGALNDLTELLREGFDWEQCARWLRAIRDRFPSAPDSAPYWECRAALEERRGDLPASVQCWEQAIAKGTEKSVVEANLDQLLDKFMQLKISPSSGKHQVDPKLLDVKNVFKSTIIRFAVQQAKLRQSTDGPKYTVTPVRRCSRLSSHFRTQTPLRLLSSIQQASELGAEFKPNKALVNSP